MNQAAWFFLWEVRADDLPPLCVLVRAFTFLNLDILKRSSGWESNLCTLFDDCLICCWARTLPLVCLISLIFLATPVYGLATNSLYFCCVSCAATSPKNPSTTALMGVEGLLAVPKRRLSSRLRPKWESFLGSLSLALTCCLKLYCWSLVTALFFIASLFNSLKSLSVCFLNVYWWGVQLVNTISQNYINIENLHWPTPSLSGLHL